MSETGWLIEKQFCGQPHWWGERERTTDSLRAARFSRKQDAEMIIRAVDLADAFATEHMWCP